MLTGEVEDVSCGLVISSIGYKSLPIDPSVPFDSSKAIVPNNLGRVQQAAGTQYSTPGKARPFSKPNISKRNKNLSVNASFILGLYCSGWLKTGPTGVIATTMNNSFDTARSLMEDMDSGTLDVSVAKPGSQSICALLEKRGTLLLSLMWWEFI